MRTYRRYVTRLRFEPGDTIPLAGAAWDGETELGHVPVRVHLLEVRRVFPHPSEPGVTLMDAKISRSEPRHEPGSSSGGEEGGGR